MSTAVRWPHSWADPCVQVCVPYRFESAATLKIPNHGLADCSDFLYPGHPCDSPRCRAVAAGPWSIPPLVAVLPRWVLCGWPTALSRLTQKAPHREKSAVDLQPLTAIQQNNFTPPTGPFSRPDNVNGMRNHLPINHFPPTLFSPNRSPIYERHNYSSEENEESPARSGREVMVEV